MIFSTLLRSMEVCSGKIAKTLTSRKPSKKSCLFKSIKLKHWAYDYSFIWLGFRTSRMPRFPKGLTTHSLISHYAPIKEDSSRLYLTFNQMLSSLRKEVALFRSFVNWRITSENMDPFRYQSKIQDAVLKKKIIRSCSSYLVFFRQQRN